MTITKLIMAEANQRGLNAGFASVPNDFQDQITRLGYASYGDFIMARELEFRVRNPDDSWTHDKAQDFAHTKAGKLLLALFGDLQP